MRVIIAMAGRSSRFATKGVQTPKPLIPIDNRPMVWWALESLRYLRFSQIIFVVLARHEQEYGVTSRLRKLVGPQAEIVLQQDFLPGQLCSVLVAREFVQGDEDLLIASADTYVVSDLDRHIRERPPECKGLISVADMPGDRWSFARTDSIGRVVEVAEKRRISNHASTGLYYFSKGHEFLDAADELIRNREKTQGEYYVIPVYTKYIQRGWRVDLSIAREMWDMGTPDALERFLQDHVKTAI